MAGKHLCFCFGFSARLTLTRFDGFLIILGAEEFPISELKVCLSSVIDPYVDNVIRLDGSRVIFGVEESRELILVEILRPT